MTHFYKAKAFRIEQPLGTFYAVTIPAKVLLEVCFADRLKAERIGETYRLSGSQRERMEPRLRDIGKFIDTRESAFPSSIILAANYREDDGLIEQNDDIRWVFDGDGDIINLTIPTNKRLAAIIDGQHRLFGFTHAVSKRQNMPLLCSIYVDLPKPFQAYLFATINSTQQPVDRSQTFELFGYNIEEEPETLWSPDKMAVFLARKFTSNENSPFKDKIRVAAENDFSLTRKEARAKGEWMISMAAVVDGIMRLVSSDPKDDSYFLNTGDNRERTDLHNSSRVDKSPLRKLYIETLDKVIYGCVENFFTAAFETFPVSDERLEESYLIKTVGIQALFDVLRELSADALEARDFSKEYFANQLKPSAPIDFSNEVFRNYSGSGRTFIRQLLLFAIDGRHAGIDKDRLVQFKELLTIE